MIVLVRGCEPARPPSFATRSSGSKTRDVGLFGGHDRRGVERASTATPKRVARRGRSSYDRSPMASYAVIIAVENYVDKAISQVAYAERDARAVDAALTALGFTTKVLLSAQATKATIESTIRRTAATLTPNDTVYVFYAGHGFSKNDTNHLTCRDTIRGDLVNTSVELKSAVFDVLRRSKCKHVALFLDACESGMTADPSMRGIIAALNDLELEAFFRDSEFYVCFASCKTDESSYSSGTINHGIWTYHLVEALSGRATLAMERGLVTSSLLQDYLAKEVPLMVRTTRSAPDPQTPWACGAMSKQFVVADLRQILAAKKQQRLAAAKQITQALLRGTKTQDVKRLSGFHRGHRVPDAVNSATVGFVQRISEDDLKEHLDALYEELRTNLGYKRRELRATTNSVETPHFEYTVTIGLDRDDPSSAVWRHVVSKMTDKEVIFSDAFAKTFKSFLDTAEYEFASEFEVENFIDLVEDLESDEITVEYERGEPECDVRIKGFAGVLHLTPVGVHVTGIMNATPRQLLESVASAQRLLVAKRIPALPL